MKTFFSIEDRSPSAWQIASEILTALLILLWVYTAGSKLLELGTFQFQMSLHHLPEWLSGLLAWLLPPGELVLAGLLATKRTRQAGLYLTLMALLLFTAYILWMFATQENLPCACGGPINGFGWWQHLIFNLSFASVALWALILQKKNKQKRR